MDVLFSDAFVDSLRKHASLKKIIQKKVDMIVKDPIRMGEPLKGNFRGYYSSPVKKNFIIIYLYCKVCRNKKDQEVVLCHDCSGCKDDTIRFIAMGPHDKAYRIK
jgi:mRNA-degrading endonuclease YafQ of YafQ-DinJ toxin-antitoxin module